jgi:hypothetical protein
MENRQASKTSSATMIAWQDQKRKLHFESFGYRMIAWQDQKVNSISEFWIPGVGGVKEATQWQDQKRKLHFGVSDTG